jgi:hypothetical protein
LNKQKENDEFKFRFNFLDENERETKDVKCFERKKNDYIDLIFIFKHR